LKVLLLEGKTITDWLREASCDTENDFSPFL
jgi:hypothetical protein